MTITGFAKGSGMIRKYGDYVGFVFTDAYEELLDEMIGELVTNRLTGHRRWGYFNK